MPRGARATVPLPGCLQSLLSVFPCCDCAGRRAVGSSRFTRVTSFNVTGSHGFSAARCHPTSLATSILSIPRKLEAPVAARFPRFVIACRVRNHVRRPLAFYLLNFCASLARNSASYLHKRRTHSILPLCAATQRCLGAVSERSIAPHLSSVTDLGCP